LFPIVQGSTYAELRRQSAEFVAECNLPGNAIGGVSVGEPYELIYEITDQVTQILPEEKPRYLMGVGTPANILESIAMGVDMFDCVMPSRNGRHGLIFTEEGIINIKNERWKEDFTPIHEDPDLFGGTVYTKAYLHHLFKSGEILGMHIATVQNLGFYLRLVKTAREKIISGEFSAWKKDMVEKVSRRL
jgi:queuine tRNA-ribosyltransferase